MVGSTSGPPSRAPRVVGMTTSAASLDATDRRLLLALDADPRATVQRLAQDLGLARGTVQARLERLGRDGALHAHSLRVPLAHLGLPLRAVVTADVDQDEFDRMIVEMAQIPEVVECLGMSGESDLMIQIAARDADHIYDITQRILRCRGIRRTATSIVLRELLGFRVEHLLTPAGPPS
ncbi:Lrp/AsnC family transcriptional regulator [Kineosporiaceae bacterium B12]|nr:Lrp/AsnC family transcriptional regulator [Kineococcus rubinsiae]